MPFIIGSTTPIIAFVAIAASTAFPPRSNILAPACAASGDNKDPAHCPMMPRPDGEWDRADGSKDIEGYRRPAGSDLALSRRLGTPWELDERGIEAKGISRADAQARMAAQASREDRLKLADHVLTNDGSVEELEKQVDALWRELKS